MNFGENPTTSYLDLRKIANEGAVVFDNYGKKLSDHYNEMVNYIAESVKSGEDEDFKNLSESVDKYMEEDQKIRDDGAVEVGNFLCDAVGEAYHIGHIEGSRLATTELIEELRKCIEEERFTDENGRLSIALAIIEGAFEAWYQDEVRGKQFHIYFDEDTETQE